MRWGKIPSLWIRAFVPRSMFLKLIFPRLQNVRYWKAHWGSWDRFQFNFRILGEITKLHTIRKIFGQNFVKPREQTDLDPYNTDPNNGEISGFMCFIDMNKKFTFSVRTTILVLHNKLIFLFSMTLLDKR